MSEWIEGDASEFKIEGGYEFPFELFDRTSGLGNLGRIGWMIEPIAETLEDGSTEIREVIVSVRRTRDPRYDGKIFRLKANTPRLMTYDEAYDEGPPIYRESEVCRNFFAGVWSLTKCREHGAIILDAHPPDGATKLRLDDLHSGVASMIWWE